VGEVSDKIIFQDMENIFLRTSSLWECAHANKIFITGGSGFFGKWFLESLIHTNNQLKLDIQVTVLTRNIARFKETTPRFHTHSFINFIEGDVRSFDFPKEKFDIIIHAATETTSPTNISDSLDIYDVCANGTKHVLELAVKSGTKNFLLVSSGAVYGAQPADIEQLEESYLGGPELFNKKASYAEGKRVSELLCAQYSLKYGFDAKIARCFAFVGPYLPLNAHFAIGNFIKNVLDGSALYIQGSAHTYRSYLYMSDLVVWLWTILFLGTSNRPYNVGSNLAFTIREIAKKVSMCSGENLEIKLSNENEYSLVSHRYIPSVVRAQTELGLSQSIDMDEAIKRTLVWYKDI
jgi:nucleoside-diphosphate-sugar epimerase